jgi:hypothetical protein
MNTGFVSDLVIGNWKLFGIWDLDFGISTPVSELGRKGERP